MRKRAGLWIDHRKAVVVNVVDGVETTTVVESDTDRQPGRSHGVRSTEKPAAMHVPADDSNDRRFHGQLDVYYDRVIASVHGAETILIFGPGEAKGELRRRIEKSGPVHGEITVETADKMTDREIAAKVRGSIPA